MANSPRRASLYDARKRDAAGLWTAENRSGDARSSFWTRSVFAFAGQPLLSSADTSLDTLSPSPVAASSSSSSAARAIWTARAPVPESPMSTMTRSCSSSSASSRYPRRSPSRRPASRCASPVLSRTTSAPRRQSPTARSTATRPSKPGGPFFPIRGSPSPSAAGSATPECCRSVARGEAAARPAASWWVRASRLCEASRVTGSVAASAGKSENRQSSTNSGAQPPPPSLASSRTRVRRPNGQAPADCPPPAPESLCTSASLSAHTARSRATSRSRSSAAGFAVCVCGRLSPPWVSSRGGSAPFAGPSASTAAVWSTAPPRPCGAAREPLRAALSRLASFSSTSSHGPSVPSGSGSSSLGGFSAAPSGAACAVPSEALSFWLRLLSSRLFDEAFAGVPLASSAGAPCGDSGHSGAWVRGWAVGGSSSARGSGVLLLLLRATASVAEFACVSGSPVDPVAGAFACVSGSASAFRIVGPPLACATRSFVSAAG
ncbi:hypothetical protein DIPPA_01091 [Diplonema papillatum]|nr:hypothetical protein DIPPA_01091 [Diplonema papillatum]